MPKTFAALIGALGLAFVIGAPAAAESWSDYIGKSDEQLLLKIKSVGSCEAAEIAKYSLPEAPFDVKQSGSSSLENPFGSPFVAQGIKESYGIWTQRCRLDEETSVLIHSSKLLVFKIEMWRHGCWIKCIDDAISQPEIDYVSADANIKGS